MAKVVSQSEKYAHNARFRKLLNRSMTDVHMHECQVIEILNDRIVRRLSIEYFKACHHRIRTTYSRCALHAARRIPKIVAVHHSALSKTWLASIQYRSQIQIQHYQIDDVHTHYKLQSFIARSFCHAQRRSGRLEIKAAADRRPFHSRCRIRRRELRGMRNDVPPTVHGSHGLRAGQTHLPLRGQFGCRVPISPTSSRRLSVRRSSGNSCPESLCFTALGDVKTLLVIRTTLRRKVYNTFIIRIIP